MPKYSKPIMKKKVNFFFASLSAILGLTLVQSRPTLAITPLTFGEKNTLTDIKLNFPKTIPKNGKVTYSFTLKGFGNNTLAKLFWSVYDDEVIDDPLTQEEQQIFPAAIVDENNKWEYTVSFDLECIDCVVYGIGKDNDKLSSGEGEKDDPTEVYLKLEGFFGGDVYNSEPVEVECVTVPEPSMILGLSSLAFLSAASILKRQQKIGKKKAIA